MPYFQRIGLLSSIDAHEVKQSIQKLDSFLQAQGREVVYEQQTAQLVDWSVKNSLCIAEFLKAIDLVIVVGGDGSILSACRKIAASDVPLLGINLGRLGFLTDITPDEIEDRVAPVLAGEFKQTQRFMLNTSISRNGEEIGSGTALNDVVLHPGMSVRMMEFELYVDGEFVYSQRSDGLIVATPTGSTAYALSAGGPLICPELDAMVCVPLNPHTLSSRPIVLHGDSKIEIRVNSKNELHPSVTCDGQDDLITEPGDTIRIKKHQHAISLIHPKDNNFYKVSRSKLGWGSRLGVKKER
ncbi:MAG: NAD(+) kinase [Porticoccaceae bacterium]|nr:NAD(+) kinase [Porticoccaceae bacterium]